MASAQWRRQPFAGVQWDTVVADGIWPNKAFVGGIGMNALVSAERGCPNGGARAHSQVTSIDSALTVGH